MEQNIIPPNDLYAALEQCCERVRKPKGTVLFQRGEKACVMFLVLGGAVNLDFGVDGAEALGSACGPGALVGLPATLSRSNYSTTATVTEDAELGLITTPVLVGLLRENPELCRRLLTVLSAKLEQAAHMTKALLNQKKPSTPESTLPDGAARNGTADSLSSTRQVKIHPRITQPPQEEVSLP
jgi:CRP-like cAMP-binding protein